MELLIIVGIVCYVFGVVSHAAAIAWFDRIKAMAKDKLNSPKE